MVRDIDDFGRETDFSTRYEYACSNCSFPLFVVFGEELYTNGNVYCIRCADQGEREHANDN